MANDPITGLISDDKAQTVVDYLGRNAPLSFTGQPALPAGAPAPSPSAATPGASGVGATPASSVKSATGQKPPDFSSFDPSMFTGGGDPGSGEGGGSLGTEGNTGSLPSFSFNSGPFGFSGSPLGVGVNAGPFGLGVGPSGSVSAGLSTGNKTIDSVLNSALSMVGLQNSVNPGAMLAALMNSPVLGAIASAISALGAPMAAIQLAQNFALGMPGSTVNMQAALNENDPHFTQAEAAMMGKFGLDAFSSPKVGGAQPIGTLSAQFETAPANVGQHIAPPAQFQSLAELFSAMLGRGVETDAPPDAPAGPGPSPSPQAEESGGGPGPGPGASASTSADAASAGVGAGGEM